MNDVESYLMWKAYGERGFAVQTTFERIQISFDSFDGEVQGGVVEYIDFTREELPVGNVFSAVVTKDLPYRDEREFRLLLWRPELDPDNAYRWAALAESSAVENRMPRAPICIQRNDSSNKWRQP